MAQQIYGLFWYLIEYLLFPNFISEEKPLGQNPTRHP